MSTSIKYTWDETKQVENLNKHGIDFAIVYAFNWDSALTREDVRGEYGEARFVSIGTIGSRLFVVVWTPRDETCRLISLRKANKREVQLYATT